jgi:CRISPR-associated protein Cmr5
MSPATHPDSENQRQRKPPDQQRAKFAYEAVSKIKDKGDAQNYKTLAKNLGVQVLQNGLGQTVAFLMSKAEGNKDSPHGVLLEQLTEWLIVKREILAAPAGDMQGTEKLINVLIEASRNNWRRAENETFAMATWLKRFAEALLVKPQNGDPLQGNNEAAQQTKGEAHGESAR